MNYEQLLIEKFTNFKNFIKSLSEKYKIESDYNEIPTTDPVLILVGIKKLIIPYENNIEELVKVYKIENNIDIELIEEDKTKLMKYMRFFIEIYHKINDV